MLEVTRQMEKKYPIQKAIINYSDTPSCTSFIEVVVSRFRLATVRSKT